MVDTHQLWCGGNAKEPEETGPTKGVKCCSTDYCNRDINLRLPVGGEAHNHDDQKTIHIHYIQQHVFYPFHYKTVVSCSIYFTVIIYIKKILLYIYMESHLHRYWSSNKQKKKNKTKNMKHQNQKKTNCDVYPWAKISSSKCNL